MKGFTYCILIPELLVLDGLGVVALALLMSAALCRQDPRERRDFAVAALCSVALITLMSGLYVLWDAPAFDFMDRCNPYGGADCLDGSSFDQVRAEIGRDRVIAALAFVVLPVITVGALPPAARLVRNPTCAMIRSTRVWRGIPGRRQAASTDTTPPNTQAGSSFSAPRTGPAAYLR